VSDRRSPTGRAGGSAWRSNFDNLTCCSTIVSLTLLVVSTRTMHVNNRVRSATRHDSKPTPRPKILTRVCQCTFWFSVVGGTARLTVLDCQIPKSPTGKVLRRVLQDAYEQKRRAGGSKSKLYFTVGCSLPRVDDMSDILISVSRKPQRLSIRTHDWRDLKSESVAR
jgi:hypothetical protein